MTIEDGHTFACMGDLLDWLHEMDNAGDVLVLDFTELEGGVATFNVERVTDYEPDDGAEGVHLSPVVTVRVKTKKPGIPVAIAATLESRRKKIDELEATVSTLREAVKTVQARAADVELRRVCEWLESLGDAPEPGRETLLSLAGAPIVRKVLREYLTEIGMYPSEGEHRS